MKSLLKNLSSLSLLALCLMLAGSPAEAEESYALDKSHTTISFSVSRFGFLAIEGQFTAFDGHFVFCMEHPQEDAVSMTLYSQGIETTDEDRDEELRGPDFFNAAQFPRIKFVSTSIERLDEDSARIAGDLTLLGVTKPVVFDAHFTQKDRDAATGDYVVSFVASGTINRSDFGMDHLIPIVGNEVTLTIQAKGVEKNAD